MGLRRRVMCMGLRRRGMCMGLRSSWRRHHGDVQTAWCLGRAKLRCHGVGVGSVSVSKGSDLVFAEVSMQGEW